MALSSAARISRWSRYLVAAVALVLALGGLSGSPASANQRGTAVNEANSVISACFKADGNPWHVVVGSRSIQVICEFEDGMQNCTWWEADHWAADCYWTPNSVAGDPDNRADGSGAALPGRVEAVAPGDVASVGGATRATGDGESLVEKQQKPKQKKARGKGKHHGKQHKKDQHAGGHRR